LTVNNLIAMFLGLRQKDEKGASYNPIMIIQNTVTTVSVMLNM